MNEQFEKWYAESGHGVKWQSEAAWNAALSSRAGEEMPDLMLNLESVALDKHDQPWAELTLSPVRFLAALKEVRDLVSSLRSQLEAKDAEIAGVSAQMAQAGSLLGEVCCYGTLGHGERAAEPSNHAAVHAILGQIERAEKAEAALSTAERDAIKKALEIAYAPDFPRTPEGSLQNAFNAGLREYHKRILALLQKERAS